MMNRTIDAPPNDITDINLCPDPQEGMSMATRELLTSMTATIQSGGAKGGLLVAGKSGLAEERSTVHVDHS